MRPLWIVLSLWLAAIARCEEPRAPEPAADPQPGDSVRLRGTLADDVDCRLLRADNGNTYSLSARLRNLPNGMKVCVHGTVVEPSQCIVQPSIEVQAIRPLSSCP